jgi:hypothetical protein
MNIRQYLKTSRLNSEGEYFVKKLVHNFRTFVGLIQWLRTGSCEHCNWEFLDKLSTYCLIKDCSMELLHGWEDKNCTVG